VTAIDDADHGTGADRSVGRTGSRPTWVAIALRLFPTAWRERFGEEFGALLDQTPSTPAVLFDVAVAAVDAHLHPTGPRRRWPLMIERLRLSELVVFASWVVFVVAGLAFQRMTEGAPFSLDAAAQPVIGLAYAAIVAGAVVSLLAVIVAGVPIAAAIGRAAIERGRWREVGLLAVPPISLAIWVALTAVLLSLGDPPTGDPWRVVAFLGWVGVFVLAAFASTVAVSAAALDAEIDGSFYRRAAIPAVVTAIAMVVVAVAVVVWGVALAVFSPDDFWSFDGILASSTPLTWLGIVLVMVGATIVAARSALHTRRDQAG
jgi:hypothetical protein